MASVTRMRYEPVGAARELIMAKDPEVLAAGAAGTGKTLAICHKIHLAASNYPNSRSLIARQTLESLKPAALNTFISGVNPALDGVTYFGGNRVYPAEFRYPNGSVIHVSGLDKAEKVKSSEYDLIYVNEGTETTEATLEMLKSRLRNGAMPYQQIIVDCNPSGPRHWLKQRADRGQMRMITSTHKDNPRFWDAENNDWTPDGRQYVLGVLSSLSGVERDRLFLGKWAAADGLVYPMFDPGQHQQEMDLTALRLTGWRTVLGVDVGTRNPTAILTLHQRPDGEHIHVSREVYRRNMTSSDILTAIRQEADAVNAEAIYIDPSSRAHIDDLVRAGYPAVGAQNEVITGIQKVRSVINSGFSIDPSCVNTIDEFGMYAYPDNPRVETDKPSKEHDHAMDALRYACAALVREDADAGGADILSAFAMELA